MRLPSVRRSRYDTAQAGLPGRVAIMDKDWIIDQWIALALLLIFWSGGVWSWTASDYNFGTLTVPVCWTILWAMAQEVKIAARENRWRWEQLTRDYELEKSMREEINDKIEWFMRNNVTIELRPDDDDGDDEDEDPQLKH